SRRSRRRFWDGDEEALRALWFALVQGLRAVAPVMPFLADWLWRRLVAVGDGAPASIHLAGWPEPAAPDTALLADVAETRRVVELGRQARAQSGLKLRQPLRRLVVEGARLADDHVAEVREELRVKDVELGPVEATELRVKPNLPVLGPKLGKEEGTELTDRIRITLPAAQKELLRHEDWIKEETLATEIETDGGSEPRIAKV